MGGSLLSVIGSIVTIVLIAVATRWLYNAKGSPLPKTREGSSVYGVKWQWRAIGLVGAVFWIIVSIWSWHDQHGHLDGVLVGITAAFITAGFWLASGSVTTNPTGITKRVLWHSDSFQWQEITEVRVHKKQGGAIELRSGEQKLIIDFRFVAFQHLLSEIGDRTQLQPFRPDKPTAHS